MFRIGEFSRISRVSKRMLHYYDDIGLLKPAQIDATNGYRFYSAEQLVRLNRILALKDLGLSLNQITNMLRDNISDDEISGMLLLKKAEMEQVMLDSLQRLRRIEARLQQNRVDGNSADVVIKSIPAQPYLASRAIYASTDELMDRVQQLLHVAQTKVRKTTLGPFVGVFYADDFSPTNNDVDLGFVLNKPLKKPLALADGQVLRISQLPAVTTMATLIYKGDADLEIMGLGTLAKWIDANGYRIAGAFREVGLNAAGSTQLDESFIELQIPVEHVNDHHQRWWL